MGKSIKILAVLAGAAACLQFGAAFSQQAAFDSDVEAGTVQNRERPEYNPVGGRIGTYFFYPSLETGLAFDDNIRASNTNKKSSMVLETTGRLLIRSDMPRHKLDFEFGESNLTYLNDSSESHTNFYGGSTWRVEVDGSFNISGDFQAARLHEGRGFAESPGAAAGEPTHYTKLEGSAFLNKSFNRLMVSLGGAVQNYNYSDVKAVGGGTIDQDLRDGSNYTAVARASYEFSPGYRAFIHIEGNRRDFRNNKDSKGIEARGGIEFEISRLLRGELSAGYLHQDYRTAGQQDVKGPAFRGAVLWNPTPLMTVDLSAGRRVSETTIAGASGRLDSVFSASVDYEVLRNVILSPHASYEINDYKGAARDDKTIIAGVTGEYLINRYLAARAFYEFTKKNSNIAGQDYDRNRIGGSLKLQL